MGAASALISVRSGLRERVRHVVVRHCVRGLVFVHDSGGVLVILRRHSAEPARVELFVALVALRRLVAVCWRVARIIEAIGPEHDNLVVALVVLTDRAAVSDSTVRSYMAGLVRRRGLHSALISVAVHIDLALTLGGLALREATTFDATRAEVTSVWQVVEAHLGRGRLLDLIICRLLID